MKVWMLAPLLVACCPLASGQEPRSDGGQLVQALPLPAASSATPPPAERVARLARSIAGDEQRMAELDCKLNEPGGEYEAAEKAFEQIDAQLKELRQRSAPDDPDTAAQLAAERGQLEMNWSLARDRLELEKQERRVIEE